MDIIFHGHHATVTPELRERAERAVTRLAQRLRRTVDATIRFEEDGPARRVELTLHAPRRRPLVAEGRARAFGPALTTALSKLRAQTTHEKSGHQHDNGRRKDGRV